MDGERGWCLGRLAGIPIWLSPSWLFIFALVSLGLGLHAVPGWQPNWPTALSMVFGGLLALCFFAGLVLHELAHALVSRHFGLPVARIRLFLFGGVSEALAEMRTPREEFWIAVAGPVLSVVLAIVWLAVSALCAAWPAPAALVEGSFWLAVANVTLAAFNLLPGFPMDGGRVLRAALWGASGDLVRATRWASGVGRAFAWLLMAIGFFRLLGGEWLAGAWLVTLGWLIDQAAQAAYAEVLVSRALDHISVARLMNATPLTVAPDLSLREAVETYFLPYPFNSYPVVAGQTPLGLLDRDAVLQVPRARWPEVRVADVMSPLAALPALHPHMAAKQALPLLAGAGTGRLPVLEHERLVGLLSQTDVVRYLLWQADGIAPSGSRGREGPA
ncbi:MAG: site-2 protease family protein [Candidatus Sericytochromatia bacterium]|nr:site-2 protease family protein [Candidatus Sericytochromatia bacterium]